MDAPIVPPPAGGGDGNNASNNPPFEPPLPQARFFYTYRWSLACDKAFIQGLSRQAPRGHKQVGRTPNMHALSFASHFINYVADWNYKYKFLKHRLNHLRLGHNTFRRILKTPGFHWEPKENIVHASIEDWRRLFNKTWHQCRYMASSGNETDDEDSDADDAPLMEVSDEESDGNRGAESESSGDEEGMDGSNDDNGSSDGESTVSDPKE
ncbi:UNVERIFIED_CONTAM: hypothetical protein Sangu_0233900 [Sesamum angustifolium]|uniref:Myb/SANT-like domain-containing protein n=1 Tax=Sesamum angustifolium TaxID=2727405 RepID=A0AAW2RNC1_9LAMI